MLKLEQVERSFTNRNGEQVAYKVYQVEIQGLKIEMKPKDNTAKQLLELYYDGVIK